LGELDLRIGSAQGGEMFNVFTASALGGPYTQFGSTFNPGTNITCPNAVCTIMLPGVNAVAITDISGNVLLTSVSGNVAAPEPASLAVLGSALIGFGMMRRRRR
jgi:hypothetical protein